MNRKKLLGAAFIALMLHSCVNHHVRSDDGFVTKDTANKMIQSYLTSIAGSSDTTIPDLHSLIIDADELRTYLDDGSVKHVKIMFAHTLDYINSGHGGSPAGYKSNALTVILAGYDANEDYVYVHSNLVGNHATPCPRNCPDRGTAANSLLQ